LGISRQEKSILKIFANKINPNDPGAHNNLACVYYNKGLIKEAVEELKKALKIEPHFTMANNNIDYIYRTTGLTRTPGIIIKQLHIIISIFLTIPLI